MVKPRRWIDIDGSQVSEVWEAGLRAFVGMIASRPGITQVCEQVGDRKVEGIADRPVGRTSLEDAECIRSSGI